MIENSPAESMRCSCSSSHVGCLSTGGCLGFFHFFFVSVILLLNVRGILRKISSEFLTLLNSQLALKLLISAEFDHKA